MLSMNGFEPILLWLTVRPELCRRANEHFSVRTNYEQFGRWVPLAPLRRRHFRVLRFWFKPETRNYSVPFCVHQGTMELMRQVAPALSRHDSKNSWILGSSSSYSICVPPSLTLTSIGLSSPRATKL